jgi:hypothetical protein
MTVFINADVGDICVDIHADDTWLNARSALFESDVDICAGIIRTDVDIVAVDICVGTIDKDVDIADVDICVGMINADGDERCCKEAGVRTIDNNIATDDAGDTIAVASATAVITAVTTTAASIETIDSAAKTTATSVESIYGGRVQSRSVSFPLRSPPKTKLR